MALFASYNLVTPPSSEQNIKHIEQIDPVEINAADYIINNTPFQPIEKEEYGVVEDEVKIPNKPTKTVRKRTMQQSNFKDAKDFVSKMRPVYQEVLKEKGLDPNYADYLVAQSALESGWGKSQSGKNNFGGIKGKSGTVRTTQEFVNGKYVTIKDTFRDFKDLKDYANYHVNLLNSSRYKAFSGDFISSVVRGGYATDPNYSAKLRSMYNSVIKR